MDLLKLPTDNFYIFLSFLGFVLIIYSITIFYKRKDNISSKIMDVKIDVAKGTNEVEYFKNEIDTLNTRIKFKQKMLEKEFNFKIGDHFGIDLALIDEVTLEEGKMCINDFFELKKIEQEVMNKQLEFENRLSKNRIDLDYIGKKNNELIMIFVFSCIGFLCGIIISSAGLYFWYNKHQIYQDELIKLNYETAIHLSKKSIDSLDEK